MNVILPEKKKGIKKRTVIYIAILIACTVAIGIAIYQFFADEKLGVIIGITEEKNERTDQLKTEFNNLFKNTIIYENGQKNKNINKFKSNEELVYTEYKKQEKVDDNYDLDINIPIINIENDYAKQYNEEIKNIFQKPAENILKIENRNFIYTVNYMANVENNILSIAILSTFKEGDSAQRTILKTYNYKLDTNEEALLNDLILLKKLDKKTVENKIKVEIRKAQEQADQLREVGYNIFARDTNDNMYKIENTKEFFINKGNLYLIYAYGNNNSTSDMDLIIFD